MPDSQDDLSRHVGSARAFGLGHVGESTEATAKANEVPDQATRPPLNPRKVALLVGIVVVVVAAAALGIGHATHGPPATGYRIMTNLDPVVKYAAPGPVVSGSVSCSGPVSVSAIQNATNRSELQGNLFVCQFSDPLCIAPAYMNAALVPCNFSEAWVYVSPSGEQWKVLSWDE